MRRFSQLISIIRLISSNRLFLLHILPFLFFHVVSVTFIFLQSFISHPILSSLSLTLTWLKYRPVFPPKDIFMHVSVCA